MAEKKGQLKNRKKNAIKAARVAARRHIHNLRRAKAMKVATKAMVAAPSAENLSTAYQAIDKAVKRGLLKKNTAARMKSGLSKKIAK